MRSEHDLLIIGGGVAGLTLALEAANYRDVTLLSPVSTGLGASRWAQGGIAAVLDPRDTIEAHIQDTLIAGDGLCNASAVRFSVEHGHAAIDWLISLGVPFSQDASPDARFPYHLTREGGHGARRIIHAADATGQALIDTLTARARQASGIRIIHDLHAVQLLRDGHGRCCGAFCLDEHGQAFAMTAHDTVLATGGASGLYLHTTSPAPACGEGMAMAAELGATLMNLEFQQFHPTCLYDPAGTPFLISEAVRGEGGLLRTVDGRRFMPDYDARAELAPRDIVARAIHGEMLRSGTEHVLLDVTHLDAQAIREHFPTIHAHCLSRGLDIVRQPIPVVPAAHYSCGGIATDASGATGIPHLYAIGEVACTGLHGANRMASNSLLECLVYARSAARTLRQTGNDTPTAPVNVPNRPATASSHEDLSHAMQSIRRIMSDKAGIVRSDAGLAAGRQALQQLYRQCDSLELENAASLGQFRLRHMLNLAEMTLKVASDRRESRGLHYNRDCPDHRLAPSPSRISRG
ncbi:L-aspartate oxidase [Halomonas sp. McH1-25]|uniref:L-aspartate oxidase n=1 Tax=unclassified Halomonas TaxID=2609666 RepID=UPI001EF6A5E5|nr:MULTISPECIES: L-aspartate oxidase [unclassified Halomonas]MCG7598907.1 L-aspartate oxidase [Halomonas sp. McH1-25]MCP1340870.1 L-aspartate oxidase [Halomonas sp. FL8]MCP1361247.1 L-aspartate oxidase [Halomonas sp. BBD45]MCP1364963.1 L-aspartate oxidase [Halomonas sp. BBD48]